MTRVAFVFAALLFVVGGTPASAEIGAVAAVNRDMDGTPPTSARRSLDLGARVVENERIETSEEGSGQLLFLDQTSLSLAPNSDLLLDRYVYDPEAGTGEIALSLGRGALRFIGGRISKNRDVVVKTPTATIGIRGGMCVVRVDGGGRTQVIQIAGEYTRVTGANGRPVTLSRPNAVASVNDEGTASFDGFADKETLDQTFKAFEGKGEGGSESGNAPPTQTEEKTTRVAAVNSDKRDGENAEPVSTSGEKGAAAKPGKTEEQPSPTKEDVQPGTTGPATDTTASGGGTVTIANFPTDGGVFSPTTGYVPFTSTSQGSIIGLSGGGQVLKIPAPATGADFVAAFTNGPTPSFFALGQNAGTGFFEYGLSDGAFLVGLGPVEGHGFADLDNGFYMTTFNSDPALPGGPEFGIAVFGTPTPGQGAIAPADDGTLPTGANTFDVFHIEPELFDPGFADTSGTPVTPDGELFLIANAGEARFKHPSHTLNANGGRVLAADIRIEIDPLASAQISELSVFVAPLLSDTTQGSGPRVDGRIFSSDLFPGSLIIDRTNVGLFEDDGGNTVFGADGRYMVATSLRRPGGTGTPVFDPGTEHELGQPDQPALPVLNVLTRDLGTGGVIFDPLPLASDTTSRESIGLIGGVLDSAMATGFAFCSSGNCGVGRFGPTGLYALQPAFGPQSGSIDFNFGQFGPVDDNEVGGFFALTDGFSPEAGIQGGPTSGPAAFQFSAQAGTIGSSAYLDDNHFAFTHTAPQTIDDQTMLADFVVVSAGLAGEGNVLPAGVDPLPEFLRWGWWSASYRPIDEATGTPREDAVHIGHWVAGARPNLGDVPFTGTATYAGLAIGTDADLLSGTTAIVGGDFSLAYDFAAAQGTFNLNIAGFAFSGLTAIGSASQGHDYNVTGTEGGGGTLIANGGFYSGGGAVMAATGGQFNITDSLGDRQVIGIYGGDAQ